MSSSDSNPILLSDGHVDPTDGSVHRTDQAPQSLSTIELSLLLRLVADAGEAVSREQLLIDVWQLDPMTLTRTVDTAVKRLRKKLEHDPRNPRHVVTVHRTGYVFRPATRAVTGWETVQSTLWNAQTAVCTLVGPAGAGKSWLIRQTFDNAPIVSVAGCSTAADLLLALTPLARGLSTDDPLAYLRASGAERVVLDGIDGVREAVCAVAEAAIRASDLPQLYLTGSAALGLPDETVVRLGPLNDRAARDLFMTHAECTPERVPDAVITWAAGHPLALRIAAQWFQRLGDEGLAPLLSDLAELPSTSDGPSHQRSIAAAVSATVGRLPVDQSDALRTLCTLHDAFSPREAADVLGLSLGAGLAVVDALRLAGLLSGDGTTLRVTRLVRSTLTPTAADARLHADWVSRSVHRVAGDVQSDPGVIDALHARLPDALRAHAWLLKNDPEQAARLALGLWSALMTRVPNPIARGVFEPPPPLELPAAERALYLARRAELQRVRGHIKQLDQTLALAQDEGLSCPELDLIHAMAAHMRGDVATAVDGYNAMATSDSIGVRLQARTARIYARGGHMHELDQILDEIADIAREAREHGYAYAHAVALSLLGRNQHAAGLLSQARTDLEEARAFFERYGDVRQQAQCAWALGMLDLESRDLDAARERFRKASDLCDAYSLAELGVLAKLGLAQADLVSGRFDDALTRLRQTVRGARQAGARAAEQNVLVWLAAALFRCGQADEARTQLTVATASAGAALVAAALDGDSLPQPSDPDLRLLATALTVSG